MDDNAVELCGAYSGRLNCGCCDDVGFTCTMPLGHSSPHGMVDTDAAVGTVKHKRIHLSVRWSVPDTMDNGEPNVR